ncbi:type VI protein secretion system component VasK, partial [Paraburkholderia bannensis]
MSESKLKLSGYWIVVVTLTTFVAVLAWFQGEKFHPSPVFRVVVVLLIGAAILLARGLITSSWQWSASLAARKVGRRYVRASSARAGATGADRAAIRRNWAAGLKASLRNRMGWRWCYGMPWLLVAGDDSTISRLMPELGEQGWLITDQAVLLWGGAGTDGRLDEGWLRQIRGLRYRRPLDAIVLTIDATTPLQGSGRGTGSWAMSIARITDVLRWSAPIYVLDVDGNDAVHAEGVPVAGCEFTRPAYTADARSVWAALLSLRDRLADESVWRLSRDDNDRQAADLSARLDTRSEPLAQWLAGLSAWQRRPLPVAGAFFTAWPLANASSASSVQGGDRPLWRYLAEASKHTSGRRTWTHPVTVLSTVALVLIGIWSAGMLISGMNNAHEVMLTRESLQALHRANDTPGRLRALLALQQRIALHEARVQEHTPLLTRFGLNHDRAILSALWTPYARAAKPLLISPVQQDIEGQLVDLGQMSTAQVDTQSSQVAQDGQQALKTYLMLADPQRADSTFMTPQLGQHWNPDTGLRAGEKLDLSAQLLGFWAQHFPAHPDWRIQPREDLVGNARQTLLAIIGVRNSEDTIYQGILDSVGHKYPDQTLASLTAGTDTRGLFATSATVPGVFTRQAWEGSIDAAIDDAAKHNGVEGNWVLGNSANSVNSGSSQA